MKKTICLLLLASLTTFAQTTYKRSKNKEIRELQDKVAIRELIDNFAVLADKKDIATQINLFTKNAVVTIISNGKVSGILTGHKEIENAFSPFINSNEIVYHSNGQNIVNITGDKANGIAYCMAYLINTVDGKRIKTSMAVRYNDEYVYENGQWLIDKRTSNFDWNEKVEIHN